jgi:hypothetical protein
VVLHSVRKDVLWQRATFCLKGCMFAACYILLDRTYCGGKLHSVRCTYVGDVLNLVLCPGMYFGGDGAWSPRVITCFGRTFFDVALTRDR